MKLATSAAVVAAGLAFGLVGGCSGHAGSRSAFGSLGNDGGQSRTDLGTKPLPNPTYVPMTDASDPGEVPPGLPAKPDQTQVADAARAGQSRADGERYALLVAQVLTDVRDDRPGHDVIQAVASPSMDAGLRAFLIQDASAQRGLHSGRHFDTSLEMWIRSAVTGPASTPGRVDLEVAGNITTAAFDYHAWLLQRVDVVWEGDHWALIGYSSGGFGPHTRQNLTAAERKAFLTGSGWRRVPRS